MDVASIIRLLLATLKRHLQVIGAILLYWVISITMVFFNKYLLGSRDDSEDISLFVAWFQCLVCVVFIIISSRITHCWDKQNSEVVTISIDTCFSRSMVLYAIFFVSMLTFNNLCLKHVGVSFFQLARSLTLIFTVILSGVILKKKISVAAVLCCLIVVAGFVLAVDQEHVIGSLSFRGIFYGVLTSVFVASCGIMLKFNLDRFNNDAVRLTLNNNFNATLIFLPLILITGDAQTVLFSSRMHDPIFWLTLTCSGMFSFLMAWASALQVQVTSPVTHHISNNTKSVLQTLLAVIHYGEIKPILWWLSNTVVICGALAYAIVQLQEKIGDEELPMTVDNNKSKDLETDNKNGFVKTGKIMSA